MLNSLKSDTFAPFVSTELWLVRFS